MRSTECLLVAYELCSHPPALFDDSQMLREPQKFVLARGYMIQGPRSIKYPTSKWWCSRRWVTSASDTLASWFSNLQRHMYCDYVTRKYGQLHVVFDGCEDYTTKFMAHQRRTTGTVRVDVTFTDEMKLSQKKDERHMSHVLWLCDQEIWPANVVFDGCEDYTTKFMTHQRRSTGTVGVDLE